MTDVPEIRKAEMTEETAAEREGTLTIPVVTAQADSRTVSVDQEMAAEIITETARTEIVIVCQLRLPQRN